MKKCILSGPVRIDPAKSRTVQRIEHKFNVMAREQLILVQAAFILALYRSWGFRAKRLETALNELYEVWHEVSSDNHISTLSVLEEETGIELRGPDNKSWHGVEFIDPALWRPPFDMEITYFHAMRQQQTRWMKQQIMAGFLTAMHRRYGFAASEDGNGRLQRLLSEVEQIIIEVKNNPKTAKKLAYEETHTRLRE